MGLTAKQRAAKADRETERAAVAAQEAAEAEVAQDAERQATLARMNDPVITTAALLARCLDEPQPAVRLQLLRSVRLLGPALALELLREATRIDMAGGELVSSGMRYRTVGGIYFRLVRELVSADEWVRLTRSAQQNGGEG